MVEDNSVQVNQSQASSNQGNSNKSLFLVIIIIFSVIVVISLFLIFARSLFNHASVNDSINFESDLQNGEDLELDLQDSEAIEQKIVLSESSISNEDFGILKFQTSFSNGNIPLLIPPSVPDGFNNDVKECYYVVYSHKEGGDDIKISLQSYENKKSYELFKNYIGEEMKKYSSIDVEERDYNGREFICTIKATDSIRCSWISNNIFVSIVLELSQENIRNTPLMDESWNQLLESYLETYAPTDD